MTASPDDISTTLETRAWRQMGTVLAGGVGLWALVFAPDIGAAIHTWQTSSAYNHGFMVGPVVLWLIWRQRAMLLAKLPRPSAWGLGLGLACALLWAVGKAALITEWRQFAVVGWVAALVLGLLGPKIFRLLRFPLAFLLLAVPSGAFLLAPLQKLTAIVVEVMLRASDITVWRDGTVLEAPMGIYRVEPGCAGLNFLLSTLTLALLLVHLLYRRPLKRVLCLLGAPLLSITANTVRVYAIIALAELTHRKIDIVDDHVLYGWGFYAVLLLGGMMLAVRYEDPPERPPLTQARRMLPLPPRQPVLVGLGLALLLAGPAVGFGLAFPPPPAGASLLVDLPPEWGRWRASIVTPDWIDHWQHGGVPFRRAYQDREGHQLELLISYHWQQTDAHKIADLGVSMQEDEHEAWAIIGREEIRVPIAGQDQPAALLTISKGPFRRQALVLYWSGGRWASNILQARLQGLYSLVGGNRHAAVLVVTGVDQDLDPAVVNLTNFMHDAEDMAMRLGQARWQAD